MILLKYLDVQNNSMNILLLSIGTRGDMEPFLTVGKILEKQGHQVSCAMPEQFRNLVTNTGFNFHPFDRRFLELLDSEDGRAIMGQKGSKFRYFINLAKLAKSSMVVQKVLIEEQRNYLQSSQPGAIIYHPKCMYARAWARQNPERATQLSPVPCISHPTPDYPNIGITAQLGPRLNLLTYRVFNYITARMAVKFTKPFRADFPNLNFTTSAFKQFMLEQENTVYTISPTLFPRPEKWPDSAQIVGYYERNKTDHWQPDGKLLNFIEAMHLNRAKLSFVTFGSMVNADPEKTTKTIIDTLIKHRIPAIINTSSGGLLEMKNVPDYIYFVNTIPYDWIFPRVHNVIHHGGSGTTHTALRHGCSSLVIPHIIDQFFWNRRVHDLGAGPLGIKVKKLTPANFEELILDLRENGIYKKRAVEIAAQMKSQSNESLLTPHIKLG